MWLANLALAHSDRSQSYSLFQLPPNRIHQYWRGMQAIFAWNGKLVGHFAHE